MINVNMDKKRNDSFLWVGSFKINIDDAWEVFPDWGELD